MSDDFLAKLTTDVVAIERRARELFGELNEEQLNRSPQPGSWGVGKCLEHLVQSNEPYFPIFDGVANRTHKTTFWERVPFLSKIWGKAVLDAVRPQIKRKGKAPKIFTPGMAPVPANIVNIFCGQQPRLAAAFASLRGIDVDKTIVTSPVAAFITYSLRDALLIVSEHEKRHMNQAERALYTIRQ